MQCMRLYIMSARASKPLDEAQILFVKSQGIWHILVRWVRAVVGERLQ